MHSRLLAVLAADAVGYSRKMEHDARATLKLLDECRAVFATLVERYGGRIVDTAGDSVLAAFPSASGAAEAAAETQKELAERKLMEFRIGIHLGDVIEKADGTLYGDGVNIAARLQALAPVGGILVSSAVRSAIEGRLKGLLQDAGELVMKNVSEPVHAWVLQTSSPASPASPASPHSPAQAPGRIAAPAIAVLPFDNFSSDPEQAYFADGMTEDLIAALARFRLLNVIARNSTFRYKGQSPDVRQVGRELGAGYVLEGSVRRSGDRLRVTTQLIDATDGTHLWAERFDGSPADAFSMQDSITEKVVNIIQPAIHRREIERARRKPPQNLTAYECYMQALPLVLTQRQAEHTQGMLLLEKALAADPTYAPALALSAYGIEQRVTRNWLSAREDDVEVAVNRARTALATPGEDSVVTVLAANALLYMAHDFDAAFTAAVRALEANPSNAFVIRQVGFVHVYAGDLDEAIRLFRHTRELSPGDPHAYRSISGEGWARFLLHEDQEAYALLRESAASERWDVTFMYLLCVAVRLNYAQEAAQLLQQILTLAPRLTVGLVRSRLPFRDPQRAGQVLDCLSAAGLPE